MSVTDLCPQCGYDLVPESPVRRDGWLLDPRLGGVVYCRQWYPLPERWLRIMHTVARCSEPVSVDALLNRFCDSEYPNAIHSTISQMNRRLREMGLPTPVRGKVGREVGGYVWSSAD